ncbi:F0F1 ATP synthase subunit delta [Candidatus Uhrbacteria bacterium]|nr:F0F1 ATP synthase subunit delta [Candidatus Uhrbacteria bacterium]
MKTHARQLAEVYLDLTDGKPPVEVQESAQAFVAFLAECHQLSQWREVIRRLDAAWKRRHGVSSVEVRSSHPFPQVFRDAITALAPGANVVERTDPGLIGGAVIRIDDRVVDGSVSGYLERLRTKLVD